MAANSTPTDTPSDWSELSTYLQDNYNMPEDEWWTRAESAFERLRDVLEIRPMMEPNEDEDSDNISARKARVGALPALSIMASGSHKLRLTSTDEYLPCVAFGTINAQRYVDIFWEAVAKYEDGGGKFDVYQVGGKSHEAFFCFNFEGHAFQVLYLPCEGLIRRYPQIINAPDSEVQLLSQQARAVWQGVVRTTRQAGTFNNKKKKVYYTNRAWSIAKGVFTTNQSLTSERIVKFQDLIEMSEKQGKSLEALREAELQSVHSKWNMNAYIQIAVSYWGGSAMSFGKWLLMVERRLGKLKERLETANRFGSVQLWPHRLVGRDSFKVDVNFYEGYYVVGLEHPGFETIADRWTGQVEEDDETSKLKGTCSIKTVCLQAMEFDEMKLSRCTKEWPRPVIAVDPNKYRQDTPNEEHERLKKPTRNQKKSDILNVETATPESSRKLRRASDVLKRLAYDQSLNIDEFMVGYEDRHADKIQEKSARDWVRDTTHEEWIPEHRIVYFKRRTSNEEQIMWDKGSKIDRIFKESGNVE